MVQAAGWEQYLIILGICVGLTIISQLFRHFFGMNPEQSMDMQQRLRELQDQMMAAQGDPETLAKIQQEAMTTYRTMMRKQLIPNCIYMILFFGLWAGIRYLFTGYYFFNNQNMTFYIPYLLFSLSLSGIIYLVRFLIKRYKKKKGLLPEDNVDPAMERSIRSGLNFRSGWDSNLSPELRQMKSDLQEKKDRGELPQDIDIDAEIEKMSEDEEEDKKDWKKRLES